MGMRGFFQKHNIRVAFPGGNGSSQGIIVNVIPVQIRFEVKYFQVIHDEYAYDDREAEINPCSRFYFIKNSHTKIIL